MAPCVRAHSRTTSAAAFHSSAVELGVGRLPRPFSPRQLAVSGGARGPGTGDPEREGTASGEGKCISPSRGGGPGGKSVVSKILTGSGCLCLWVPRGHGESWTDQLRTPLILPLPSRQQWAVREHHQRLYSCTLCQTMEPGKRALHTLTPPRSATGQVPAFHLTALLRVIRWSR